MFGCHVYKNGKKLDDSIRQSVEMAESCGINMNCAQIFVIGPRNTHENVDKSEISGLQSVVSAGDFKIIVHGSYLDNPWGKKEALGIHLIRRELTICDEIGADGLVIHLHNYSAEKIASLIPKLLSNRPKAKLYLEIESHKPTNTTYETPEKLAHLFHMIKEQEQHHDWFNSAEMIGLCVDTAHLWAAGVDVSSAISAKKWIDNVKQIKEIKHIMLHLNDQINPRGSGKDEHAPLCYGTIWRNYNPLNGAEDISDSGLYEFLDWVKSAGLICIIERKPDKPKINNKPEIDNLQSDYNIVREMGYFLSEKYYFG